MTNIEPKFVVKGTKVPVEVGDALDALAERRHLTPSALLRALVDRALSEDGGETPRGPVETAVLAELEGLGYRQSPGRVAAALELARRLDSDPTNAAPNAGQLRLLLAELDMGAPTALVDSVVMARLLRVFKLKGFTVVADDGHEFSLVEDFDRSDFEGVLS